MLNIIPKVKLKGLQGRCSSRSKQIKVEETEQPNGSCLISSVKKIMKISSWDFSKYDD